jgi:putative phage-type endonuclease
MMQDRSERDRDVPIIRYAIKSSGIMTKRIKSDDFKSYVDVSAKSALSIECLGTFLTETPESHSEFEHLALVEPPKVSSSYMMPWDDPFNTLYLLPHPLTLDLFMEHFVKRSREKCLEEGTYPQRSDGWHLARAFCITASQFGAAVGHNKYLSRPGLLRSKLHPHQHPVCSSFAEWGVEHEVHAEEAFKAYLDKHAGGLYYIDHPNILKHEDAPWVACSPDGVLIRREGDEEIVELIEYKAPAYYRNHTGHPYKKDPYNIPKQYMDQIQGSMWLMRNYDVIQKGRFVNRCWFVVWQPHALYVTHVPYLERYANTLMESVKEFFMKDFAPGCIEEIHRVQQK